MSRRHQHVCVVLVGIIGTTLVAIALNLALAGMLDIAVRDVVMAVSAFVLARLADAHEVATARAAVVSATGSLAKRAA